MTTTQPITRIDLTISADDMDSHIPASIEDRKAARHRMAQVYQAHLEAAVRAEYPGARIDTRISPDSGMNPGPLMAYADRSEALESEYDQLREVMQRAWESFDPTTPADRYNLSHSALDADYGIQLRATDDAAAQAEAAEIARKEGLAGYKLTAHRTDGTRDVLVGGR